MTPESERPLRALTYDSAAARLRSACQLGGIVLLASPLLPFEVAGGQPVFLWEILGELHPATAAAAFAPLLVGALLLVAARRVARPSLLGFSALLTLGTWAVVVKLGADAAAWDVGALPESLNRRVELYVLSIALSGAALRLLAEPAALRASRILATAGVLTGVVFGAWPGEGEAPLQSCLRFLGLLVALADPRLMLGYGLLFVIAVFPVVAALVALSVSLAGRNERTALVGELTTFGAPALIFALALRNVLATYGDVSVVVTTAIASALAAVLAIVARSFEVAAMWTTGLDASSDHETSPRARRFVRLAASTALGVVAAMFVLSRPVTKGIAWTLGPRTPGADQLFGELLPKWAASRARWSVVAKGAASAAELAEARAAANDVLRAARALRPEVARAVAELVQGATELDLAGRRWFRLIEGLNESSRAAQLPYYLDPSVQAGLHGGRVEPLFLIQPYRVETVRPASVGRDDYALLGVRGLGKARENHDRLGFSRDHQPFALVVLDEVDAYATSLTELAAHDPPTCTDHERVPSVLASCGALLKRLSPTPEQVSRLVERHELQHQIDGPALTHAGAVLTALKGYERSAVDRVNRELSAYLAELVTEGVSPKLALVHVLPFVVTREGSSLNFVGHLELAALSRQDDIAEPRAAFDELVKLPDAELRERARTAHRELFGADLPEAKFQ